MSFLVAAESWLLGLAETVPLEGYVFIGAAVEEIIAPIPSPIIMTFAGSIAQAQSYTPINLLILALVGAVGKTLASIIVYVISDKAEDIVVGRFGKFLGVTTKEIEQIGNAFNGGKRDTILLTLARAIPIMPTAPVSIVCGIIKLNIKAYILGTFLGTIVRNIFYLILGYLGVSSASAVLGGLDSMEKVVQLVLAVIGFVLMLLLYWRRRTEKNLIDTIRAWFRLK
jgi:membrane protein DedA with SNARE-associated domain